MSRLRYASEWDSSGYATAARRCLYALSLLPIDLSWQPLHDAGLEGRIPSAVAPDAPVALRAMRRPAHGSDSLVIHCPPRSWRHIANSPTSSHVIGHTVWEADRVPKLWKHEMDMVDEFWVPTEWNRRAFIEAFDRPVHVVPHVLEFQPSVCPPIEISDNQKVIAIVTAWDWRKRPEQTLRTAMRAFEGRNDVTIVVKTGHFTTGWPGVPTYSLDRITDVMSEFPRGPKVIPITDDFTDGEMLGLLERAQCFFSLTAAEGWGLGAFDAAGVGTPVVITGHGGQIEWLGTNYPGLVPFTLVDVDHPDTTLFESGMKWANAHVDSAIDLLRAAVDATDISIVERSSSLRDELQIRFSAQAVAQILVDILPDPVMDVAIARSVNSEPKKRPDIGSVLVLTPVKNASHHAEGWVNRVLSLRQSCESLDVAVLVSDSDDHSAEAFHNALHRLSNVGINGTLFERDYGFTVPEYLSRWAPEVQYERRTTLALSRNYLLFSALRNHDWVLWLDADVVSFDSDILETLVATGADIVQPHCVREPSGPTFDTNAWTDHGTHHLSGYRGHEQIELHAVGGTMLLVRADCHRDGLVFTAYPYGVEDERSSDNSLSDAFGLIASATGYQVVGLSDVHAIIRE